MIPGMGRLFDSFWFRCAAVSVTAAVIVAAVFALAGSALVTTLQRALIYAMTMGALAGWVMPRLECRLAKVGAAARWGVTIGVLLSLPVLGTFVAASVISVLPTSARAPFWTTVVAGFPINALLTVTVCVGMTLYESQRRRLDEVTLALRTKELEHERARKSVLEARLASLESRLRPHFLFNTLNAISELIHEDPDRAERTLERLAALLRFSLDATERGIVSLADELRIVSDYLEIEKTRLGERLSFQFEVDSGVQHWPIPPLAIQTLVENSVKHAIAPRPEGGRVRVAVSSLDGHLVLAVADDGPGFTPAAICPGHGLDNLQGRLNGRYGATATLDVARRDGETVVTVSVPATG